MFSNTAAFNDLQGQCVTAQSQMGTHWNDYIPNEGGFSLVSALNNRCNQDIRNGCYTFLKPTQMKDFEMVQEMKITQGAITDSFWPLRSKSDFLITYAQITDPQGLSGYWTRAASLEYNTTSTWRELRTASVRSKTYESAMEHLREFGQFYKNSNHIKEILGKVGNFFKKAGAFAWKHREAIGEGIAFGAEMLA